MHVSSADLTESSDLLARAPLVVIFAVQILDAQRRYRIGLSVPAQLHAGAFPVIDEYHAGGFERCADRFDRALAQRLASFKSRQRVGRGIFASPASSRTPSSNAARAILH